MHSRSKMSRFVAEIYSPGRHNVPQLRQIATDYLFQYLSRCLTLPIRWVLAMLESMGLAEGLAALGPPAI